MIGDGGRLKIVGVLLFISVLCAGCAAQLPEIEPLDMGVLARRTTSQPPIARLPQSGQRPDSTPIWSPQIGEESYTCLDGSRLQVSYSADYAQVWLRVNESRAIIMRRADENGIAAYHAERLVFIRSGPRAVVRTDYASVMVARGDTLGDIAFRTYGDRMRSIDIARANDAQISDVNLIYPGQVLQLPPAERRCRRSIA